MSTSKITIGAGAALAALFALNTTVLAADAAAPAAPATEAAAPAEAAAPEAAAEAAPAEPAAAPAAEATAEAAPAAAVKAADLALGAPVVGADGKDVGTVSRISSDANGSVTEMQVNTGASIVVVPAAAIATGGAKVGLSMSSGDFSKLAPAGGNG